MRAGLSDGLTRRLFLAWTQIVELRRRQRRQAAGSVEQVERMIQGIDSGPTATRAAGHNNLHL